VHGENYTAQSPRARIGLAAQADDVLICSRKRQLHRQPTPSSPVQAKTIPNSGRVFAAVRQLCVCRFISGFDFSLTCPHTVERLKKSARTSACKMIWTLVAPMHTAVVIGAPRGTCPLRRFIPAHFRSFLSHSFPALILPRFRLVTRRYLRQGDQCRERNAARILPNVLLYLGETRCIARNREDFALGLSREASNVVLVRPCSSRIPSGYPKVVRLRSRAAIRTI